MAMAMAIFMAVSSPSLCLPPGRPPLIHTSLANGRALQLFSKKNYSNNNNRMRMKDSCASILCTRASEEKPFWSFLLESGRFSYSSDLSEVDTLQLSELWAKTLCIIRDPQDIKKALKNSYMFVAVLEQGDASRSSSATHKKLIGFGRAVSDGAFIATICDVAVDPAYRRRGIGRRIVKELVKKIKRRDGPTGFAVFPVPKARLFFWNLGFRGDTQFRLMTYRGKLLENVPE